MTRTIVIMPTYDERANLGGVGAYSSGITSPDNKPSSTPSR